MRTTTSVHDALASSKLLGPPVLGHWLVVTPPGHAQHAFDLIALGPNNARIQPQSTWRLLAGLVHARDFFGWSQNVFAPLSGDVISAHDGEADRMSVVPVRDIPASFLVRPLRYRKDISIMAGNHVILATGAGYILFAHLRLGSIRVHAGSRVDAGSELALVGNSGNSIAPHLHLQVMDGPDPETARVTPCRFASYEILVGKSYERVADAPLPSRMSTIRFSAS